MDASSVVTFTNIACTKTAGDVQTRIKLATAQATLGAAAWIPSTGYYTAFPATVTGSNSQWARLEFSLSGGSTVQDITLSWTAGIAALNIIVSRLGLNINRKLHV